MRFSAPASKNKKYWKINFFDIFLAVVSPLIAIWLRGPFVVSPGQYILNFSPLYFYVVISIVCTTLFSFFIRINQGVTHLFSARDMVSIISASLLSIFASVYVVFIVSRFDGIPRTIPLIHGLVLICGLVGYRIAVRSIHEIDLKKKNGAADVAMSTAIRRILIVGLDSFSISVIRLADSQRPRTIQVIAAISLNGRHAGRAIAGVKVIGSTQDLGHIIEEYRVHGVNISEVWVSDNSLQDDASSIDFLKKECDKRGIILNRISQALNLIPRSNMDNVYVGDEQVFSRINNNYLKTKRFFDVISSLILSILVFPLSILVAIILMIEVGAPILFWQERVGLNGKKFLLYKFRTLGNALDREGRVIEDTERLSLVGEKIRAFRLDEAPQLFNIIFGDMSLIGPRPLLPRDQPKNASIRLMIRPGITGWAQVNGGELLSIDEKNALDCWYVFNACFELDLLILSKTLLVLVKGVERNPKAISAAESWLKLQEDLDK